MAKDATKKPRSGKRQTVRKREPETEYVVAVESWDWSLSFGVNPPGDKYGAFMDYRHLDLTGTVLRPLKTTAKTAAIHLMPEIELNEDRRGQSAPTGIGSVSVHSGHLEGLISIPADTLPPLLTLATADRLKFIVLRGEKLRYGHARIRTMRVEMHIDEDDLGND